MLKKSVLVALSLAFLAGSAEAALLSDVDGNVMIKKGRSYRKASSATKLKPGDRVLVRGEGSARVTYGANCERIVGPNQTFVVPRGGNCGSGNGMQGDGRQGTGLSDADKFVLGTLAIGGAFLVGTGDNPASP